MEKSTQEYSPGSSDADHLELKHEPTIEPVPQELQINGGILVDVKDGDKATNFKLAQDGHTVLIPQPTDDPNDPLNWSWRKKHAILFVAAFAGFTADYTSTWGPAVLFPQMREWDVSVHAANRPNNLNVLAGALGGLIWVPVSSWFGRAPVMFWTAIVGFAVSCGAAAAPSYGVYFAMRVLTSLFLTAGQTMTIAVLKDIFFFHERARKIGLWALLYIASPYFGPQYSNFILYGTGSWTDVAWVGAAVVAINIILVVLIIDETWYDRTKPSHEQPERASSLYGRFERLVGIWQIRHHNEYFPSLWPTFKGFFEIIYQPAFFLVALNYLMNFAWAIGINISGAILFAQPEAAGGYGYNSKQVGYLYFTPIVAIFLGEIFGHYFNDFMARRYVRKHGGVFEPEVRIWTIHIAILFMAPGLILFGFALEKHLNVAAVIFGWGMHTFGLMVMSVANIAYGLDSYPTLPAEVGGWLNFARLMGGFSVDYYQTDWANAVGYDGSFGTQAAISVASIVPAVIVHIWGKRLRAMGTLAKK
ncbi:hypothetical protein CB0940_03866 [Cercospora beticola]|uniref:MFS general substrate transporter n=1 Tax=Cercospora beticola TaxID=122368 RepID=A0A2G5HMD0_CERBT|nr:hypothetical protein CB0940_03866 [Cercospora beticola]PIA93706.1 hypothetical protein CB0940_03866 [Cercospora beticola]WPB01066.1 hypothetical protein RHO25_005686 [Cercospora beticola]CAK1364197.1 unnamed protein product [Cercospora beticola]